MHPQIEVLSTRMILMFAVVVPFWSPVCANVSSPATEKEIDKKIMEGCSVRVNTINIMLR